jgi:hypothetical protein
MAKMTKAERERLQDESMINFMNQPEPPEQPVAAFMRVMRSFYDRAGHDAAMGLAKALQAANR